MRQAVKEVPCAHVAYKVLQTKRRLAGRVSADIRWRRVAVPPALRPREPRSVWLGSPRIGPAICRLRGVYAAAASHRYVSHDL